MAGHSQFIVPCSLKLLIHFRAFFPWALPPLGYILHRPPLGWFTSAALTRSNRSDTIQFSNVPFARSVSPYSLVRSRALGLRSVHSTPYAGFTAIMGFCLGRSQVVSGRHPSRAKNGKALIFGSCGRCHPTHNRSF